MLLVAIGNGCTELDDIAGLPPSPAITRCRGMVRRSGGEGVAYLRCKEIESDNPSFNREWTAAFDEGYFMTSTADYEALEDWTTDAIRVGKQLTLRVKTLQNELTRCEARNKR